MPSFLVGHKYRTKLKKQELLSESYISFKLQCQQSYIYRTVTAVPHQAA